MKTPILLILLILTAPALAAEQIPDSAIIDNDADNATTNKKRFSTPELNSEEMQGLYLKSPIELDNTEEQGMRSVNDAERYSETDLLFRERLQGHPGSMRPPQQIERPTFPTPPRAPPNEL
tara:strand:+ start:8490 stop:8852 length:363 start_codon:yes stop_codon:yes gene_type:complete